MVNSARYNVCQDGFMQVNWLTKKSGSPILLNKRAEYPGLGLLYRKALAGEFTEHVEDDHEINITLAGRIDTRKHSVSGTRTTRCGENGTVCVTPALQPHSAIWTDFVECITLNIDPVYLRRVAVENDFSSQFELIEDLCDQDLLVSQIALALFAESENESSLGKLYSDSLLQTLYLHVLRKYSTATSRKKALKGGLSGHRYKVVTDYINDNLDGDINLVDLAEVAGLSRFHFSRAFKETAGLTPQKYLMQQRIEKAKELLSRSDLPLSQVGLEAGFKNQSHFTSLFRRFTKLTPGSWRKLEQT